MLLQENTSLNNIYIAFIVTNTGMGRMIRLFTHNQYSHVTIAFEHDLRKMYSFARYHINSPISGGFVVEQPKRYLYNNRDVRVKLCKLPVTSDEYERIQQEIAYFQQNREIMIYNTMNAVLSLLGKRFLGNNMYTCLEFVTYLLRYPNMLTIRELEKRLDDFTVYCGSLKEITDWEQVQNNEDEYFIRRRRIGVAYDTVYHFRKVVGRMLSE